MRTIAAIFLCLTGLAWSVRAQPTTGDRRAEQLQINVVRITATLIANGTPQLGFGFIVGELAGQQLVVVTADHVVRGRDPGAEDKTPLVTFFLNQGTDVRAALQNVRLPPENGDLAVLLVPKPTTFRFVTEAVASTPAARGLPVWLIGRAGRWDIPPSPGVVARLDPFTSRILVEGLGARIGSSGGPLISAEGIVGMIVADNDLNTEVIPINPIREQVRNWGYPWQLVPSPAVAAVPTAPSAAPAEPVPPAEPPPRPSPAQPAVAAQPALPQSLVDRLQGRWTTGTVRDCQTRYYLWRIRGAIVEFRDQKNQVDIEQLVSANADGLTTMTLESEHSSGRSEEVNRVWRYQLEPDGRVHVLTSLGGGPFTSRGYLTRCGPS